MTPSTPIAQGNPHRVDSPTRVEPSRAPRFAAVATTGGFTPANACLRSASSRGFTLIEMLVSLAITLIMMGAVVTLFGVVSESVSGARSAIEMADRLRGAKEQLQLDLQGVTATMKPPLRPENNEGYFEIIEGQFHDNSHVAAGVNSLYGDVDDVLMFTTRNRRAPFLGKLNGTVNESTDAEVVYFLVQDGPVIDATTNPPTKLCTLYRRVLLVSPSVGPLTGFLPTFYTNNDLSVHFRNIGGTDTLVPNTLGDLTKRECRFAHNQNAVTFPFQVDTTISPVMPFANVTRPTHAGGIWPQENGLLEPFVDTRFGDDVLLTNVLSFDVRVYDPEAPLIENGGVIVEPRDPGWSNATAVARGAFVDLGYYHSTPLTNPPISVFERANPDTFPTTGSFPIGDLMKPRIYDTWSLHYENDGIDQDGDGIADAFTDGLDNDGNGLVDDELERDTLPPYKTPLRGIKVTIRVYEPSSQQVREAVVIQNFDTK